MALSINAISGRYCGVVAPFRGKRLMCTGKRTHSFHHHAMSDY